MFEKVECLYPHPKNHQIEKLRYLNNITFHTQNIAQRSNKTFKGNPTLELKLQS